MAEDTRSSEVSLAVGARGWDHAGWVGSYFPDDLPRDWRLAYYANEFRVVLVPRDAWRRAPEDDLYAWCAEVDESFRFVLEMSESQAPRITQALLQAREPVRERVAGLLFDAWPEPRSTAALARRMPWVALSMRAPGPSGMPVSAKGSLELAIKPCWTPQGSARGRVGGIGLIPADVGRASPRTLRGWVESFLRSSVGARSAHLFFDGRPPELQTMRDALVIAGLLGAFRAQD